MGEQWDLRVVESADQKGQRQQDSNSESWGRDTLLVEVGIDWAKSSWNLHGLGLTCIKSVRYGADLWPVVGLILGLTYLFERLIKFESLFKSLQLLSDICFCKQNKKLIGQRLSSILYDNGFEFCFITQITKFYIVIIIIIIKLLFTFT